MYMYIYIYIFIHIYIYTCISNSGISMGYQWDINRILMRYYWILLDISGTKGYNSKDPDRKSDVQSYSLLL